METNTLSPYPEVNTLLQTLLSNLQSLLGDRLVGMYLFGSLVNGGFDAFSDIDVLVVTGEEVSDSLLTQLAAMHALIAAPGTYWATNLECLYFSREALRRFDPANANHPHLDRGQGERLQRRFHDSSYIVQRYVLRERGLALWGPPPRTLIDPVSPDDLRRVMIEHLNDWAVKIMHHPALIRGRGYQSYTVLSVCRILYTLKFGDVTSKQPAARWAQETLGEPWASLIQRAWTGRQNSWLDAEPGDIQQTVAFIRLALDTAQPPDAPYLDNHGQHL